MNPEVHKIIYLFTAKLTYLKKSTEKKLSGNLKISDKKFNDNDWIEKISATGYILYINWCFSDTSADALITEILQNDRINYSQMIENYFSHYCSSGTIISISGRKFIFNQITLSLLDDNKKVVLLKRRMETGKKRKTIELDEEFNQIFQRVFSLLNHFEVSNYFKTFLTELPHGFSENTINFTLGNYPFYCSTREKDFKEVIYQYFPLELIPIDNTNVQQLENYLH